LKDYLDDMSSHYLHDQIFLPFGGDFNFMNAFQNYKNMDAMIEYMNVKYADEFKFIYSTPSKYVDAIKALEVTWPVKYDDMFPYSDHPDAYWTGYFSSRANSKEFIRRGSHNLHATTNVFAEKMFDQGLEESQLKEILAAKATMMDSMGIVQHHDAVSGTEKQHVVADYDTRLFKSMKVNN
jgi:hypothetical protein